MVGSATADEVWLFGSFARGQSNGSSDVDVLVVCEVGDLPPATLGWLRREFGERLDVAQYSYRGLQALAENGSLFTWHLRNEAIPLCRKTNRLEAMLAKMKPYTAHAEDLEVLRALFEDAAESLAGQRAIRFDLGIVGTVVRNAAIVMHDLFGSHDFSPLAPMRLSSVPGAPKMPIDEADYALLQACRRASERGDPVGRVVPLADLMDSVLEGVRQWLWDCADCATGRRD